uniref:Uncharacterized protein n=1 Tax=Octopus bimaculoides TaxID=37653 RepID=A0A0L8FSM4_OCTBM
MKISITGGIPVHQTTSSFLIVSQLSYYICMYFEHYRLSRFQLHTAGKKALHLLNAMETGLRARSQGFSRHIALIFLRVITVSRGYNKSALAISSHFLRI